MRVYFLIWGPVGQDPLGWFSSESAANFGNFLSGVTAVLGLFYLIFELTRWVWSKRKDKVSNTAEDILNKLDIANLKLENWLNYAQFAYDKEDKVNKERYEKLSEEHKRQWDEDKYEVRNYVKDLNSILEILSYAKNKSYRLRDKTIVEEIDQLKKLVRSLIGDLQHKFSDDKDLKIKGIENLSNAHAEIEKRVTNIRNKLCELLMYD